MDAGCGTGVPFKDCNTRAGLPAGALTVTAALAVAVSPAKSVAMALTLKDPARTLVQLKVNGEAVFSPSFVVPLKNSTLARLLSGSTTLAEITMSAGAV